MATTPKSAPDKDPKFATRFFATNLRDHYCDLFAMEIPVTTRVLAAAAVGNKDYKPEPHSRTAHELAEHIVMSDLEFMDGILGKQFHPGVRPKGMPDAAEKLADFYSAKMTDYLGKIRELDAAHLNTIIPFYGMEFPATTYLAFLQNHSVHHRGELCTYLRPMGSKVPDIYGGSYDEPFKG